MHRHHTSQHSFPTRRSSDLGNAPERAWDADPPDLVINLRRAPRPEPEGQTEVVTREGRPTRHNVDIDLDHSPEQVLLAVQDRKSTRLNSSHSSISYAVFCLK